MNKEIKQIFKLDEKRLGGFVCVLVPKFDLIGKKSSSKYTFKNQDGTSVVGKSMRDILNGNNTILNPVVRVEVEYFNIGNELSHHAKVTFDKRSNRIEICVNSDDSEFAKEVFSGLEEQVLRIKHVDTIYRLSKLAKFAALSLPASIACYLFLESSDGVGVFLTYLSKDFMLSQVQGTKFYIFSGSLLFVLYSIVSLLRTSVGSLFLWGDQIDELEQIHIKRSLWTNVCLGSLAAGLVVSALSYVLTTI
ncbi:hypothetical protein L4C39_19110 [Vibrio clamense]|uniref:hypothetical protein n=1 Tax=Vibrio clamense TaxID=2910254 RepID=UPI003D1FA68D